MTIIKKVKDLIRLSGNSFHALVANCVKAQQHAYMHVRFQIVNKGDD